jgi:hypothetical protein
MEDSNSHHKILLYEHTEKARNTWKVICECGNDTGKAVSLLSATLSHKREGRQ